MRPYRLKTIGVLILAVGSVVLTALGPRILGHATDLIFEGLFGNQFPATSSKDQVIDQVRASGDDRLADMLQAMDFVPGVGVDFSAGSSVLLVVLVLYVAASVLSFVEGSLRTAVVQGTGSEERRIGKECVSTCRSWWARDHKKN